MSIHRDPVTHFEPSSSNMLAQVEAAMAERMEAQTAADFPLEINTAKGSDRFATVEAAAEWLAQLQPSFCDINGESFDWDGDADEDDMASVIAEEIRCAIARAERRTA